MKKYIINISVFSLLVIITLAALELYVRQLNNPYKIKEEWVNQHHNELEILVLGSSHSYFGINPEYMPPNTFNAGNTSQDLKYDYLLLKKYIPISPRLKLIILSIDYQTFPDYLEYAADWFRVIYYNIYMNTNQYSLNPKYNFELAHIDGMAAHIKTHLKNKKINICSPMGQCLDYTLSSRKKDWDDGLQRVSFHTRHDDTIVNINQDYLNKIVGLCESNKIQILMVSFPAWHTYYENIDNTQMKKHDQITSDILSCNQNVKYLDLFRDPRFIADDFYDSDHLTDVGAQKLSYIINQYITQTYN